MTNMKITSPSPFAAVLIAALAAAGVRAQETDPEGAQALRAAIAAEEQERDLKKALSGYEAVADDAEADSAVRAQAALRAGSVLRLLERSEEAETRFAQALQLDVSLAEEVARARSAVEDRDRQVELEQRVRELLDRFYGASGANYVGSLQHRNDSALAAVRALGVTAAPILIQMLGEERAEQEDRWTAFLGMVLWSIGGDEAERFLVDAFRTDTLDKRRLLALGAAVGEPELVQRLLPEIATSDDPAGLLQLGVFRDRSLLRYANRHSNDRHDVRPFSGVTYRRLLDHPLPDVRIAALQKLSNRHWFAEDPEVFAGLEPGILRALSAPEPDVARAAVVCLDHGASASDAGARVLFEALPNLRLRLPGLGRGAGQREQGRAAALFKTVGETIIECAHQLASTSTNDGFVETRRALLDQWLRSAVRAANWNDNDWKAAAPILMEAGALGFDDWIQERPSWRNAVAADVDTSQHELELLARHGRGPHPLAHSLWSSWCNARGLTNAEDSEALAAVVNLWPELEPILRDYVAARPVDQWGQAPFDLAAVPHPQVPAWIEELAARVSSSGNGLDLLARRLLQHPTDRYQEEQVTTCRSLLASFNGSSRTRKWLITRLAHFGDPWLLPRLGEQLAAVGDSVSWFPFLRDGGLGYDNEDTALFLEALLHHSKEHDDQLPSWTSTSVVTRTIELGWHRNPVAEVFVRAVKDSGDGPFAESLRGLVFAVACQEGSADAPFAQVLLDPDQLPRYIDKVQNDAVDGVFEPPKWALNQVARALPGHSGNQNAWGSLFRLDAELAVQAAYRALESGSSASRGTILQYAPYYTLEIGPEQLLPVLGDPYLSTRREACGYASNQLDEAYVPVLLRALRDPNLRELAQSGLEALRDYRSYQQWWRDLETGAEQSPAAIASQLRAQAAADQPKAQRVLAIRSLGALGRAEALPYLIELVGSEDAEIAAAAMRAVEAIHEARGVGGQ